MTCDQIKIATILKIEVSKRSISKRDDYKRAIKLLFSFFFFF